MIKSGWTVFSLGTALLGLLSMPVSADNFRDPLDTPAPVVRDLERAHLVSVGTAGDELVAVGARGLIVISDDEGVTWKQIESPVSSDLLELHFVDDQHGWIVGHDGVVLHSEDGGYSWVKQLDGRLAAELLEKHFEQQAANGDEMAESYLEVVRLNYMDGPEQALMDVWFANRNDGFVVGTFGTILATRDGGKTWQSWMERVDNPEVLHFMSISGSGNQVFIASERGIVFRLDAEQQLFVQAHTDYTGSFFTVLATGQHVLAGGLRGTLYVSDDQGRSWEKLASGIQAALTDATELPGERVVMASIDGRLVLIDFHGEASVLQPPRPGRFSSVAALQDESVMTVGLSGIRPVSLN
ncbi:MAG TPA: glycosyl hydrolase [Pseudomonas xinjiangensis]|uniref:Glycosyl hydrolase n=2 Tax=root TaxID=1 RepID=A0A7V1BRD3_9GAMM|nr:glycosyl hydrolase [Halopseudomonas xinjiangensis]HEC47389.1 glycosyl hydrolase [Halopseudomonas xinjiangensis]